MAKVHVIIGAVLAMTVTLSDGTVELSSQGQVFQQAREHRINCFVRNENFVAWKTPAKPARPGKEAIPSENITLQSTGRRTIERTGDNYRLKIIAMTADDGGLYECRGSVEYKIFNVSVDFNFIANLEAQNVRLRDHATIKLGVSSYPPASYSWVKDGQPLMFNWRRQLDAYTGNIMLKPVRLEDEGNYTCTVRYGTQTQPYNTFAVNVVVSPIINKYRGEPVERQLTEGYSVTFHCDIKSGKPRPTITWYYTWNNTDKKVDRLYDPRMSHPSDEEWTITGIQQSDKGKYRCIAENIAGKDDLRFEITGVDVPPKIDPIPDILVNEGENVMLECKASGSPLPVLQWYRHGWPQSGQMLETDGQKRVAKVSLTNIKWTDGGIYTCKARSDALDSNGRKVVAEESTSVNVKSPPRLISSPAPVYTFIGNLENTSVLCEFSGYPVPLVKMVNENGTEVATGNGSALFVIQGTKSDEVFGEYNCSAVNTLGNKVALLELRVAVLPGMPRQVFANTTCKDVSIKWKNPEDDGGMPVTNYVIRLSLRGATLHQETVDGSRHKADINYDRFEAETPYMVDLMARNAVGYSDEESVAATTKKYCVPGKPLIKNTESNVGSSFTLTWTPPSNNGGDDNIKYKVEWRKKPINDDTVIFGEDNIAAEQLIIKDLEAEAEYEFRVYAENQAGFSEPDIRSFSVMETTAAGPNVKGASGEEGIGAGAIAGIVIAVILIVLITIDLFCCFFNSCGFIFCCHQVLCGKSDAKKKDMYKVTNATEMEKKPLPESV